MMYFPQLYVGEFVCRVLGSDTVFLSREVYDSAGLGIVRPQAKIARCTAWEGAWYGVPDMPPENLPHADILRVQCGRVAQVAPDGEFLCQDCILGWFCARCGGQRPEYGHPDHYCASCEATPEEPVILEDLADDDDDDEDNDPRW